jgi:hypothetical protein
MHPETRHRWVSSITKSFPTTTTIVETLDPFPQQIFNNNNNINTSSFFLPLTIMSNGRDRTSEFQTTVKTFASRQVSEPYWYLYHFEIQTNTLYTLFNSVCYHIFEHNESLESIHLNFRMVSIVFLTLQLIVLNQL